MFEFAVSYEDAIEDAGATLLTREEDKDPLSHPWFFTATSAHTFDGSDHLKFTSRSQQPKVSYYHRSDLAEIAYFTEIEEDETVTLYRWLSPSLPLGYVPDFPSSDDERSFILAENLREFSMRFRTADGEWTDSWDSTQLEVSGQLPTAVEIAVALFDEELLDDPGLAFDDAADPDAGRFVRHVVIPQPPLDLLGMIQAKIEGEAELVANNQNNNNDDDDDSDGSGMSVGQCVSANLQACSDNPALGPDECNYLATLGSVPVADYPGVIPPEWGCI